jgi:hypothetical protein
MSRLTEPNPTARELVTEILDGVLWWDTLKVIVQFLDAKNVQQVRVEFGFVLGVCGVTFRATERSKGAFQGPFWGFRQR